MSDTPTPSPLQGCAPLTHLSVQRVLGVLLEGYECAHDLQVPLWEFGTEPRLLLACGCSPHILRWLVQKGYAEERVRAGPGARAARCPPANGRKLPEETCLVLTDLGAAVARQGCSGPLSGHLGDPLSQFPEGERPETPVWDEGSGELRFRGWLVKRFRNLASNQRSILDAFQTHGWPERLADPLREGGGAGGNMKQRLHDAIKNLNRGHQARCLHFYGAGSGRVVGWRSLE
jgi:hypothetical protein